MIFEYLPLKAYLMMHYQFLTHSILNTLFVKYVQLYIDRSFHFESSSCVKMTCARLLLIYLIAASLNFPLSTDIDRRLNSSGVRKRTKNTNTSSNAFTSRWQSFALHMHSECFRLLNSIGFID